MKQKMLSLPVVMLMKVKCRNVLWRAGSLTTCLSFFERESVMRKKIKCLVLVLMLCLGMCGISINAHAATEYVEGYLRYTVEDGSVTIAGYNGGESEVTIPSKIAGVPVNTIASGAFSNASAVKKINLPDTIMTIEEGAFAQGQTIVYNSNTDNTVITNPEQPINPEQPTNSEQPTNPEQLTNQEQPSSENTETTPDKAAEDKTGNNVKQEEKTGSVEEVDIDFDDGESSISSSEEEMVDSTSSAEKTSTINDNESNKEDNNKVNKKTGNIVFVCITVVIVGIAAVAGFILYRKKIRK